MVNRCFNGSSRSTYGLTVLAPIKPDAGTLSPKGEISRYLATCPTGPESPLAKVSTTHQARWVVIAGLPYEGYPAHVDFLKSSYLLFTSNFDGDLDVYLEALATRIPETISALWTHCVGFPGVESLEPFKTYMKACQIETTFYFGAYPDATVEQVLRALAVQRRFVEFVLATQGKPARELQQAFQTLIAHCRQMPTPNPGSV